MIVTENFIWIHFPKCAGTELESVFRAVLGDGARFDELDPKNVIWHHSVRERMAFDPGFSVGGRRVLACFRRLPHWLLSRVFFEIARSPQLRPTREMLLRGEFFENDGRVRCPDDYIRIYADDVTDWMRTECLEQDFRAVCGGLIDLSGHDLAALFTRKNRGPLGYVRDPRFHFTPEDLAGLYARNPLWAELERRLYGGCWSG